MMKDKVISYLLKRVERLEEENEKLKSMMTEMITKNKQEKIYQIFKKALDEDDE